MATYTTYDAASGGAVIAASSGGNYAGAPAQTVLTGTFDAAKRNLAAADVVEVVNIPAGTLVRNVAVEVLTVDATQTVNVGDGADPDGWVVAADAATLGITLGAGALASGKFYAAADTIDVEVPATKALDTAKVRIVVDCVIMG